MGIFEKGSSFDPIGNAQSRNRRNSSSSLPNNSGPISIVPAPSQGNSTYLKSNPSGIVNSSSVFGRQQSWSDQLADSSILKGSSTGKINSMPSSYTSGSHSSNVIYGTINNTSSSTSNSNDVKFVHSTMEILENQIKREEAPKKKRTRTSMEQLRILQKAFQTDPMPNSSARMTLSKKLSMSSRAVQVWFQNRRAKEKLDAKRNFMGVSGGSSFAYVKGSSDEEDGDGTAFDDDGEYNFDEEESVNGSLNGTDSSSNSTAGNNKSSEFMNSMKANGMIGRMAFGDSSNTGPIKSQRSCSTPNGFFLCGNGANNNNFINAQPTNRHPINHSTNKPLINYNNINNPICHLFPGETFISDVNEASVDQLYQDLGGAGSIPSPIDDLSGSSHSNLNMSTFIPTGQTQFNSTTSSSSSSGFFNFGDPFYGGGIIDRTPSVSPVGFGPRSNYYPIGSTFDYINMSSTGLSSSGTLPINESHDPINFPTVNTNACKGISGGNVYLTSSIGNNNISSINNNNSNRRSFSLPETHGNLTFQQMQQLENFGLQVFPSPLLSINEEEYNQKPEDYINNNLCNITQTTGGSNTTNSNDFLIPFSDFLEGEVIR